MSKDSVIKAKQELQKELDQLEKLESKLSEKKSKREYDNLSLPFIVGKNYFIRTVTYFAVGKVKAIVGTFLVLEEAAWVADTGRFTNFIAKGVANEQEPVDVDMYVNTNSITDAFPWKNDLLRKQK